MKRRTLGRTNLQVTEMGFGCWAIGGSGYGPTDDRQSLEALETAWEAGVRFFDTADTYGHGHSETLLSGFLRNKPRQEYVLASKVGWDFYHGPNHKCFEPEYLRFACEQSLQRLKLGYLDICQLHNPIPDLIEKGEAVGALDVLRREGKIRFVGVSIHTERDAMACLQDDRIDTLQLIFNMLDQRMADKVFPEAVKKGVGLIAREPLACGLLSGKYTSLEHVFDKLDHRRRWIKEKLDLDFLKMDALKKMLAEYSLNAKTALEYVLSFPEIGVVIPGAKTRKQVLENVAASLQPEMKTAGLHQIRKGYKEEALFEQFF